MKLAEIHIYSKYLEIIGGPYTMAGTEIFGVDTTIVKLVGDNGFIGWGESCPLGASYQEEHALGVQAALQLLSPNLIGEDLTQPKVFRARMDQLLNGHNSAKASLNIALLDVLAKKYKVRVCDLLGGAMTEQVPSYYALGIGEADEIAKIAQDKVSNGFTRLQLKVGGRDIQQDIETIKKVFQSVPANIQLVVDANRGMTANELLQLSIACNDIPIIIEQPCNTVDEILSVRDRIPHAINLDENAKDVNSVIDAISRKACDGFGLKVTRLGGLTDFATVRDICEARSTPITCDDAFGGDIIAAACVQGGATVNPKLLSGVWIASSYIEEHYDQENPVKVIDGCINLPKGVGLGVSPDETKIGSLLHSFS